MLFVVNYCFFFRATQWGSWLRNCAGSVSDGVIGIFQLHNPSDHTWVDSASKRNEYKECFLENKGRHRHVPSVFKSGNLNLLEPSGRAQACTRITLHIYFSIFRIRGQLYANEDVNFTSCLFSLRSKFENKFRVSAHSFFLRHLLSK